MSLRMAITGSTGIIGNCVFDYFSCQTDCGVFRCVRPQTQKSSQKNLISWDPDHQEIDQEKLEGLDVFVHLAGANIATKPGIFSGMRT